VPEKTLEPKDAGVTVAEHACARLHRDNRLDPNCGDRIAIEVPAAPPPASVAEALRLSPPRRRKPRPPRFHQSRTETKSAEWPGEMMEIGHATCGLTPVRLVRNIAAIHDQGFPWSDRGKSFVPAGLPPTTSPFLLR